MSKHGNYRADFIKKRPGKKRLGKKGYWYKCANCGNWCGRPGEENAYILDFEKMEVDHIRPWIEGGSDAVWNLQPLCKPCNRSKSNSITFKDKLKIFKNNILHFDFIPAFFRRMGRKNKILKGLGITSRK